MLLGPLNNQATTKNTASPTRIVVASNMLSLLTNEKQGRLSTSIMLSCGRGPSHDNNDNDDDVGRFAFSRAA